MTAPANDNFSSSEAIEGVSGSIAGTNVDATKELGEPDHAGNAGGSSVWWTWLCPASGECTVSTVGSVLEDTVLAVYLGNDVASLSLVAENDDTGGGLQSEAVFDCISGAEYHIAVDGYDGAQGGITLSWNSTAVPVNKDGKLLKTIATSVIPGKVGQPYIPPRPATPAGCSSEARKQKICALP